MVGGTMRGLSGLGNWLDASGAPVGRVIPPAFRTFLTGLDLTGQQAIPENERFKVGR
jgi:hypothetical protein